LNPFSRAISSSTFEKLASFSMMSSVRSPASIVSRSSSNPSGRGSESRDISTSCSSSYVGATAVPPPAGDQPPSPSLLPDGAEPDPLDAKARVAPLDRPRPTLGPPTPPSPQLSRRRLALPPSSFGGSGST
jgi:hypothetical protein